MVYEYEHIAAKYTPIFSCYGMPSCSMLTVIANSFGVTMTELGAMRMVNNVWCVYKKHGV